MNIIDQYVNQSHHIQTSKKKSQQMEALGDPNSRHAGSLETSLVEKGSRMSHTEHKKGRNMGEKKNSLLKKSQTQAYSNSKNNSFNYND